MRIVNVGTPNAKPVRYAEVPEYDQEHQAVFEVAPVDKGDYIFVGVEVREVEQDDGHGQDML